MHTMILKCFAIPSLVAAIGIATLVWQQIESTALRREIATLRAPKPELAQAQAENSRLRAQQVSVSTLKSMQDDQAAVVRLREELKAIQVSIRARTKANPPITPLPARLWQNMGRAAPSAAVETVLWAAAGGNMDVLLETLGFTPEVEARAEAIYAKLPDSVRASYASARQLIATFVAKDIPLTSAMMTGWSGGGEKMKLSCMIRSEDGVFRPEISLNMNRFPDGWRLMVPAEAVDKYAALLAGTVKTESEGK